MLVKCGNIRRNRLLITMKGQLRKKNKFPRRDKPLPQPRPPLNPNRRRRARRSQRLQQPPRSQLPSLLSKRKNTRKRSTRSSKLINMKSISTKNSIIRSISRLPTHRNTPLFTLSANLLSNKS